MLKKCVSVVLALVLCLSMCVFAFAEDSTVDYETGVKPIIDGILKQLSVTNIVTMLASVIGAGIAFVFLWWAIRKGISVLMSAIRKGKVSS